MQLTHALQNLDRTTVFDRLTREPLPPGGAWSTVVPGLTEELVLWLERMVPLPNGAPGVSEADFRYQAGARSVVALLANALETQKRNEATRQSYELGGPMGDLRNFQR